MSVVFSLSRTKVYIGGPEAFLDSEVVDATFTGQTWVEIKGVESMGELGDEAQYGSFMAIGDNRATKFLTHFEGTDWALVMARNAADPGQIALRLAGEDAGTNYAMRIVYDDAPPAGTPSEERFIALVGPLRRLGGSNTDALKWASSLGVNSNILTVDAAA